MVLIAAAFAAVPMHTSNIRANGRSAGDWASGMFGWLIALQSNPKNGKQ
jgi:hypothetical protein